MTTIGDEALLGEVEGEHMMTEASWQKELTDMIA